MAKENRPTWASVPSEVLEAIVSRLSRNPGEIVPQTVLSEIPVALIAGLATTHQRKVGGVTRNLHGIDSGEALDAIADGIGIKPRSKPEMKFPEVGAAAVADRLRGHFEFQKMLAKKRAEESRGPVDAAR